MYNINHHANSRSANVTFGGIMSSYIVGPMNIVFSYRFPARMD